MNSVLYSLKRVSEISKNIESDMASKLKHTVFLTKRFWKKINLPKYANFPVLLRVEKFLYTIEL